MNVVFLGLGGNLDDRQQILGDAICIIDKECGPILKRSSFYETQAWGSSSGNKYLNLVLKINTGLNPGMLIKKLNSIEERFGRKRTEERNSDRTIDIDILFFNQQVITMPGLEIPHPRLHLRKFVLVPLSELEKDLRHPLLDLNVEQLLNECPDKLEVVIFE